MKTSNDSFDSVGDGEALLGADATPRHKKSSSLNKCSIALWMTATFLTGVVAGLSVVYLISSPTYNQCVEKTTLASELTKYSIATIEANVASASAQGPYDQV